MGSDAEQKNELDPLIIKKCDWIIANDVSRNDIGFESDFNKVSIFYKDNSEENIPESFLAEPYILKF